MTVPVADLSPEQRAALTSGRDLWTTNACEAAGIPSIRMADGPVGIASGRVDERDIALLTPSPIALGATWDPELVAAIGNLVGSEAAARDVDVVLAPNVNLPRSPLTGRLFEMFSEDPFLTGTLASAWISGLQARGVGCAVKHFVANDSETDRHSMNSVVDEATLRQVYLQPFEHCVNAGVWALMTAYNRINGDWCSSARALLTDVVKQEWSFDGVILSDWFGTHGVEDAAAGLDLEMPGPPRHLGTALAGAVADERLSDAALRVALLAERVTAQARPEPLAPADAVALIERAAVESCVLLRNDGLLPLAPGRGKLAVIGPNAATPALQGGSFARIQVAADRPNPVTAITARFGADRVAYARGVAPDTRLPPLHLCDIHTPQGERGVLVEILDEAGTVLFSETRNTSLLIWFAQLPAFGALDKAGSIRVRTRFTAGKEGEHSFLFGGTGTTQLSVNGVPVGTHDPQVAPADIMGALMRGDTKAVLREMAAGDEIELEYLMHFTPVRALGLWFGCVEPVPADMTGDALALAANADAVVLMVGESQDAALESVDRTTTTLAADQIALIEAVCAANPRTVVVVNAARPVDMAWADLPAAILQVWFPGQEFGPALASILAGDAEPGGRLPLTFACAETDYPAFDLTPDADGSVLYHEGDAIGYRSLLASEVPARFAFGHGFGYADVALQSAALDESGPTPIVRAVLENHSERAGKAVAQLYMEIEDADGGWSAPRLVGYAATRVDPRSRHELPLAPDALACRLWDSAKGSWSDARRRCRLTVGLSADDRRFRFEAETGPKTRTLELG